VAPRPNWKGYLKLSLVSCSIALYPATSNSERVSFNQLNKITGNRIREGAKSPDQDKWPGLIATGVSRASITGHPRTPVEAIVYT